MADIRDASALARKPSGWGCPRLRDTRLTRRGGLTGGCQMGPTATMSASPVSAIERESAELRARRLAAARRRATALLAGVTGLFVALTLTRLHRAGLCYVQARAYAAHV